MTGMGPFPVMLEIRPPRVGRAAGRTADLNFPQWRLCGLLVAVRGAGPALMRSKEFAPAICLIGCFTIHPGAHAENIAANSAPPRVFVDAGACPFECCTYRQWTAGSAITVWDQPNGKRVVALLQKGDLVEGITGEVRSTPHPMKSDRDIPETEIKAGDVFYVLHYEGEGYWKIWFRGKLTQVHESVVRIHSPKAEWWVKIKDAHGNIGWTVSHGNFQHQDACE